MKAAKFTAETVDADRLEDYLVQIAPTIKQEEHIQIMDEYHKLIEELKQGV